MLSIAMGDKGSFCDNCAAPATRGFELTGFSGMFFCTSCAERKFGERETQRAIDNVKGAVQKMMALKPPQMAPDPLPQRPMGFLKREEPTIQPPTCAT
jgi:hypothetical protein